MPISATAMVLEKMNRPLKTWRGMNAALQYTGVTGSKNITIPRTSCGVGEKNNNFRAAILSD